MNIQGHRLNARWLFLLVILLLQGCATTALKTEDMRKLMLNARYAQALDEAENLLSKKPDGVMENLNVGLLRQLNQDYIGSNRAFEVAKKRIEKLYATSVSEQAGSLMLNEETISFQGERFEQVLLHLFMANNYLHLGNLDGARVELLQSQVKLSEWGEPEDETPIMHYFSGILYELLGEDDAATVSYRKAVKAYQLTNSKHGLGVPRQLQYDLLRMLARMDLRDEYRRYQKQFGLSQYRPPVKDNRGELIVLVGNGLVPEKQERAFYTWAPSLSLNVKIAVPAYPFPPKSLNRLQLSINQHHYPLETVSNLDGLARAALAKRMPVITSRAIARAVIKKKTEKEIGDRHGVLGQFAMMAVNIGTEIADTRCWNTLPQVFDMVRVPLPAGEYTLHLDVVSPGGHVIDTLQQNVSLEAGQKMLVMQRWIARGSWNLY